MYRAVVFLLSAVIFLPANPAAADYLVTWTPSFTLSEEYTDNADLSSGDGGGRTGRGGREEESDWITVLSPAVSLEVTGRTRSLSLHYAPGFVYYAKNEDDSTVRHNLNLAYAEQLAKHWNVTLTDTFTRTEEPYTVREPVFTREDVEERPLRREETLRRERRPYYENATRVGFTRQFGPADFVRLGYIFSFLENDDPTVEDNRRHRPSVGVTYWFQPHLGVDSEFSYERGDFSGGEETDATSEATNRYRGSARLIRNFTQHLNGFIGYTHTVMDEEGEGADDYTVYEPFVGFDYAVSEDTFMTLSIGYFYQDSDQDEDESGLTASGDIARNWRFRRGSVRLSGGTGYDETFFGAENLGFTYYYQAQLSGAYAFSKRMNGTASLDLRRDEYLNEDPERKDNTATFGSSLSYVLRPWLLMNFHYTYRNLDSNLGEEDYDENRVMLSFTVRPSHPYKVK